MKRFLTKKFTNFKINSKILIIGLNQFVEEVKNNLLINGKIIISSQDKTIGVWAVKRNKDGNLQFNNSLSKYRDRDFENFVLNCIREHTVLTLFFKNFTGQEINDNQIIELWGYRLLLIENMTMLSNIPMQELYDSSVLPNSNLKTIELSTIYCGQDGKIFGWDNI